MATIIDPPSGWKYGFPKPIPKDRKKDVLVWLVEQGYPQSEIDDSGDYFPCRYWKKEEAKQRAANYMSLKGALDSQYIDFSNPNADKITSASTTTIKEEPKQETSKVTRIEVIQHSPPYNGRAYTNYNAKDVEIQFQDDGRTLKIFLK